MQIYHYTLTVNVKVTVLIMNNSMIVEKAFQIHFYSLRIIKIAFIFYTSIFQKTDILQHYFQN